MKKLVLLMILLMTGVVLLGGCGVVSENGSDVDDGLRTYTEENIRDFIDDDNDQELVKIKDLKVVDGKAQYPGSMSSYVVECDNEITLREGSTVTIVGNVRGYGLDNLDIILGLSNCEVR